MIKLLDKQFILPIQTLSAPHTSTSLCQVLEKPSSSYCSISRKIRTHCERCLHRQLKLKEILSLQVFSVKDKDSMTEILSRLIASIIEVIEKQMSEHLDGSLSNVLLATAHKTYLAPAHDMFAEQTLGLADHHFRTAPNVTIGFIDGKVKTKINNFKVAWKQHPR